MKRPIKFRGVTFTYEVVYGDLIHQDKRTLIQIPEGGTWDVRPETVAQLVGYDCDGNEVYEGDTVVYQTGVEYSARLVSNIVNSSLYTLKEDDPI